MTENQPNPPESAQPQPQTPAPQPSDTPAATGLQPQKPSFIKTLSIKALRGTIGVLEKAVEKLEAPPPAQPQPSFLDKVRPLLLSLWNGWVVVLDTIRSFLPASLSQKLPNWGLTGAIAGLLALVIWTGSALFSEKPPEVAKVPSPAITTPPELNAPSAPVPVEPVPEPLPELTPEQRLIASIQEQVTDVTTQYAEGLIQSVEANFKGSLLVVKVSDDWYNLKNGRQDKLAKEMLQRAKDLDFSRLKITDSQRVVVARSPVIGTDMVILKRRVSDPEALVS